ncbi:head completion/stabilization protein [Sphingomonas sp. LT1P40]|uniref:head completion/stabilization protein n=1 Tax=Alteristakelama amylovorans TaxID=3096166 RepID=UPI002FCB0F44
MTFVTDCTPSIVPPPATAGETPVTNDGWFPPIDPADIRATMRIRDSVTPERLRGAIVGAIIAVGNQLAAWKAAKVAAGAPTLADVVADQIDGQSRTVLLYHRAIAAAAKVELVERYRDVDLTGAGQRQVEEVEPAIGELRRDMIHAIRDLLGVGRTTVELI